MNKKEIMEEIEKFDINNVEFNYDLSNVFTILRFSHKLEQAYLGSVSKKTKWIYTAISRMCIRMDKPTRKSSASSYQHYNKEVWTYAINR